MRIQTNLFTKKPRVTLFCGAIQDPKDDLEEHPIVKPASQAAKTGKQPEMFPENTKMKPYDH